MRKKSCQLYIIIIFALIIFILLFSNSSMGSGPIDDPNSFKPGAITNNDINVITSKSNQIIGAITTIGVIVSAITLGILGIKYMIGSVEEKAEYKKSMIPYIIGSVFLFATSSILSIIAKIMQDVL